MSRCRLIPFRPEHAAVIQLREIDARDCPADLGLWARVWASGVVALSLVEEETGEIVACAGIIDAGYGREAHVWALTSVFVDGYGLSFHRAVKTALERAEAQGIERFNALVHPDNHTSMRWLTRLGFQREGYLRRTGPDGQDRYIYARVT